MLDEKKMVAILFQSERFVIIRRVLFGFLDIHGMSSGYRWRRQLLAVEGKCEYIE
jgi:hypothetical protein